MLKLKKEDLKKSTMQYDVILPKEELDKEYEKGFKKLSGSLEVEGFRKGKAPQEIAEKHITKDHVYKEILNDVLQNVYTQLIEQEKLKPIIAPRVELLKANEKEDWEIRFKVASRPEVKLKDYQKTVKELNADQKKEAIWIPGKDEKKPEEIDTEQKKRERLNVIFESLLKTTTIDVPELLIEEEMNKRLTQMLDDIQKVGLSVDNYLQSKNETMDSIKAKIKREVEDMYKLEFILEEIAEAEKISVEEKDLSMLLENIQDPKAKEEATKNAYFYASLLRRQKTLDFLTSL